MLTKVLKHILPAAAFISFVVHAYFGLKQTPIDMHVLWLAFLYFVLAEGSELLLKVIEIKWPPTR